MPTVSSWISPNVRKGEPSGIAGRGLFAVAPIRAGEVVAVKGGHLVDSDTLFALPERLQNSEIQIAEGLHLVALTDDEYEPVMLFINHSCEPNVGFAGNVVLAAMRDVEPGEELTTDYALFDTVGTTMACSCGTPSCRGTITGDDWSDPALRARYAGWFSRYLEDRQEALDHPPPDGAPAFSAGEPDVVAPDRSDVRVLGGVGRGGMAHFELAAGQVSVPVRHRTVDEIWYFVGGRGEMALRHGDGEEVVAVRPGVCVTIPVGTRFQLRASDAGPLAAIGVTMPPWPGDGEAVRADGPWAPTMPPGPGLADHYDPPHG